MDSNIRVLIQKFFDGQCSFEEKLMLDEWYHSYDQEQDPDEILDENKRMAFEQLMLERINANINRLENGIVEPLTTKRRSPVRLLIYTVSGIAAMLLVAFGLYFIKNQNSVQNNQTLAAEKLVFTNNSKSIRKVALADGSTVWLNPGSKLEAVKNFQKDKRVVFLNGFAFFEVTKNPQRPFIIKTSTITTKVWGTSFTVNAYEHAAVARVSVLTGKVSVSKPGNDEVESNRGPVDAEVMLLPNQDATYSAANHTLLKEESIRNNDLKIWKKVNMSFYNTKMSEVIKKLNQQFAVHIIAGDSKINDYLFIADLSEQDLPSTLEILKTSLDLNYEIDNDTITLRSNN